MILVILAFAIYGGINRNTFIPSDLISEAAPIVAVVISLLTFIVLWRHQNPNEPYNNFGPIHRALAVVLGAMMLFPIGWLAMWGVASAIVWATAPESSVQASVDYVHKEHHGKGCSYRLQVHASSLPRSISPCVSKEIWQKAKPEIPVTLVVASGPLGTHLVDARLSD